MDKAESGTVTLQVVEGVLAQVTVEPNPHFNATNITRSLPALQPGKAVNIFELNRNLVLANESGSKVTNVTFKRNLNNKDVDASIKVQAEDPARWLSIIDNSGSDATGNYRVGLIYQHANVLNRDHAVSVQVMTSPDHIEQVAILGLGYKIPFYQVGGTLELSASHSSVNSGQVASTGGGANLAISGKGETAGLRFTYNLDSTAEWQRKVNAGVEGRSYGNSVTLATGGESLVPSLTTLPLTVGYSATYRNAKREFSFSSTVLHNLPEGPNGSTAAYNQPGGRSGARGDFSTLKFSLQHTERFESQWALRTALSLQWTDDLLIAAEQFGAGGSDSVRGFGEREVAADQGARLGLELWAPPLDLNNWRLLPIAFADAATVARNRPQPGEIAEQHIASVGLGLRAAWGKHLSTRLDWGYVTQGVAQQGSGTATGYNKLHATVIWNY